MADVTPKLATGAGRPPARTGAPYAVLAAVIDSGQRLAAAMKLARENGASTRDLADVLGLPQAMVERMERELAQ